MKHSKQLIQICLFLVVLIKSSDVSGQVTADFSVASISCVNSPVTIQNSSVGGTTYYWSFCAPNNSKVPVLQDLGNPGNFLSYPVFSDYVKDQNGNYFVFITNYGTGNLIRLAYGSSLLNVPTATNLGNFNGVLAPGGAESIKVVFNESKWYAIIVGSNYYRNTDKMVKISFGTSLSNNIPTATDWGNFAEFGFPHDFFLFKESNNWYAYVINKNNSTLSKVNFSTSFENTPTGTNLGNLGGLNYPAGIFAIVEAGVWHLFIANSNEDPYGLNVGGGSITRIDFGNGLLAAPTLSTNLGGLNGNMAMPRDISIMRACGGLVGYVVNQNTNDIVRLDFTNGIANDPAAISLGSLGGGAYPHSITQVFRNGNDLYFYITDLGKNNLSRLKIEGCNSVSIPSSTAVNPPQITYTSPGVYNINLVVDEGLATEASICKQITINGCVTPIVLKNFQATRSLNNSKCTLTFETLNEEAGRLIIERAYDNLVFAQIQEVRLKGDGLYIVEDDKIDLTKQVVYYRVRVVSNSGKVITSEIRSIHVTGRVNSIHLLGSLNRANPSSFDVLSDLEQRVGIKVIDISGRVIFAQNVNLRKGLNKVSFGPSNLYSSGVYIITFSTPNEEISKRIIINR